VVRLAKAQSQADESVRIDELPGMGATDEQDPVSITAPPEPIFTARIFRPSRDCFCMTVS